MTNIACHLELLWRLNDMVHIKTHIISGTYCVVKNAGFTIMIIHKRYRGLKNKETYYPILRERRIWHGDEMGILITKS